MFMKNLQFCLICGVLTAALLVPAAPARAILGLFEEKVVTEEERAETVERIQDVQEKLKLLQEKLRVLEQRKAAEEVGETGVTAKKTGDVHWQEVNEALVDPGQFGVYTYILFAGDPEDDQAIGKLEDLVLTIETLPQSDSTATLGNRFLIPLEQPVSSVELGRQPYDFGLSRAYLARFGLSPAVAGPLLVSSTVPVDPYGTGPLRPYLTVLAGERSPTALHSLLQSWHQYQQIPSNVGSHPLGDLFLTLLKNAGPTQVEYADRSLSIDFAK